MNSSAKEIEDRALRLSILDRVSLAERILNSLDDQRESSLDEQWATESEDRIKAYEEGILNASDASEVFDRLERKYGS